MTYFAVFKNIISFILTGIAVAYYVFFQGKKSEKNNQTKRILNDVLETSKRKETRFKTSYFDKLKWLRRYDKS